MTGVANAKRKSRERWPSSPNPEAVQGNGGSQPLSSKALSHVQELDGVRGLAIFMVLCSHAYAPYTNTTYQVQSAVVAIFAKVCWFGWTGVNLFFILSGFLITRILLDTKTRGDYYRRFYKNRFLRIVPAYVVTVFVAGYLYRYTTAQTVLSLVFLSNMIVFLTGVEPGYRVLWSVCVEEHFYAFWPLLSKRLETRHLLYFSGFICAFIPLLRAVLPYGESLFITWFRFDSLAWGAIIAILVRESENAERMSRILAVRFAIAATVLACLTGPFGGLSRSTMVGRAFQCTIFDMAFASLFCLTLWMAERGHKNPFQMGWLRYLGRVSYGLYLYHQMLLDLTTEWLKPAAFQIADTDPLTFGVIRTIGLVASLTIASLSFQLFERPILKFKSK